MSKSPNDLNSLINQAQSDIAARKPLVKPALRQEPNRQILALLLLSIAVLTWGWHLWSGRIGEVQIRDEARELLIQAKAGVDRELTKNDRLPAILPDVLLRNVVSYRIVNPAATPPVYELAVEINGVRETLRSE